MRAPAREAKEASAASPRAATLRPGPSERALATPTATAAPRSFAAIPVFAPSERAAVASAAPRIALQRKLAVGAVDDPLEAEADRVAEQVMRMPDPVPATPSSGAPVLRRKCACEGSGAPCAACSAEHEDVLQRKSAGVVAPTEAPPIVHEVLASPGRPLDAATRTFFEPRFGYNFSRVRVHTDAKAAESARALNALAYTAGREVVFGAAGFSPGTPAGKRLIAHELAHVAQQAKGQLPAHRGSSNPSVNQSVDSLARQSDEVAARCSTETASPSLDAQTPTKTSPSARNLQRQASERTAAAPDDKVTLQAAQAKGPSFRTPYELPLDEAARRVNEIIDLMGSGLTHVRRPPMPAQGTASGTPAPIQTFPDGTIRRQVDDSSPKSGIHAGVVGSLQLCWDCLTGEASLKGWIWAGVGYVSRWGWYGAYYFDEKEWLKTNWGNWFEPGTCDPRCDPKKAIDTTRGRGFAGFPIILEPYKHKTLPKAGLEVGVLLTSHGACEGDIELIALADLLEYLGGPVGVVVKQAVKGANALTGGNPEFELKAGIDLSATFHYCKRADGFYIVDSADLCGGGFIEAGIGLSFNKTGNHGAT
jgi:hypothetical protein